MNKSNVFLIVLVFTLAACSKGTVSGTTGTATTQNTSSPAQAANGSVNFTAPDGWVVEKTSSSMRVAQYKLPKQGTDSEDGSLVLYYFGQGQGGATQANIDRWISQMHQPDGSDSKDKAKSETLTVNGLKVSMVDVSGTYSAEMSPGSGDFTSKPNYRLRAAVIETPKGSYFAKLTGPEKTIAHWDQAFRDYINSFQFK
ncbi:MAG TPA: hypothetical protein VF251_06060 [Pyrinomonadaceae bacterium]